MSVTTTTKPTVDVDVDKTGSTATGRFTIKNLPTFDVAEATKPLFAVVGVADLAIEQAKDVPADVTARVSKVQARLSEVPAQVKTLPTQVKTLSDDLTEKATDLYTQLTLRGERLVTQIRRQPATEAAIAEGKEAVRKAEAAAIAAKKSAKAGEKAVEDAAAKIG
jgi:predicted  nucleic acid-binding Zn-ribbon protein